MPKPQPVPNRAACFAREKQSWGKLAATWRGMSNEALLQPDARGAWSVKDLMNHRAAWQEAGLEMIGRLQREEFASLGASTDRFNAKQIEADQARSLAATRNG